MHFSRYFRPSIGPSFVAHMDQQNNDQSTVTDQFQQQQNADTADLLNAIVGGAQQSNQLDCTINAMDSNIE